MLIALLVALGVELIVIVALVAFVLVRKRWLKHQPGEFAGAMRLSSGELDGLSTKWKRGSGRWVSDVFVWSKAPLMFRSGLAPIDHIVGERQAHDGEVKRLGDTPVIVELLCGDATIEVATKAEHGALVAGPFADSTTPASATVAAIVR